MPAHGAYSKDKNKKHRFVNCLSLLLQMTEEEPKKQTLFLSATSLHTISACSNSIPWQAYTFGKPVTVSARKSNILANKLICQ